MPTNPTATTTAKKPNNGRLITMSPMAAVTMAVAALCAAAGGGAAWAILSERVTVNTKDIAKLESMQADLADIKTSVLLIEQRLAGRGKVEP